MFDDEEIIIGLGATGVAETLNEFHDSISKGSFDREQYEVEMKLRKEKREEEEKKLIKELKKEERRNKFFSGNS